MAKAQADKKAAEFKDAAKTLAKRGITRPKHVPQTPEGEVTTKPRASRSTKKATKPVEDTQLELPVVSRETTGPDETDSEGGETDVTRGVDTPDVPMVNSGFSIFNPTPVEQPMSNPNPVTAGANESDAAVMARAKAEIAERDAAHKAAKEAAKAEKARLKALADEAKAEAKAAREAKFAEARAAREAKAAELAEAGRKYTGSMLALAERVKQGLYVKSTTGQLRSTDELAEALDAVPAANVVKLGMILFDEANKYEALNIGQQSMNYRNRIRGAIRQEKITLADVIAHRDNNGFATGDEIAEAKAAAKAEKARVKAEKLAAADAAKAEKLAAAKAKAEAAKAKAKAEAVEA